MSKLRNYGNSKKANERERERETEREREREGLERVVAVPEVSSSIIG